MVCRRGVVEDEADPRNSGNDEGVERVYRRGVVEDVSDPRNSGNDEGVERV